MEARFASHDGGTPEHVPWLPFSVTTEHMGESRCVVWLAGEVDMVNAPEFEREMLAAIENGAREVVIDLTHTSFIDSSCLRVLVDGHRRLNEGGGRFSIVCGDRNLLHVFEIAGLERLLAIHPTDGGPRRPRETVA